MAKEKKVEQITDMEVDFAQWYTDVCRKAELVEYASVKGFTILRPYGYAIWENMQRIMDGEFKKTGHENVAMPVLIPESLLKKEGELVNGFAPEVAWVTMGGSEKLEERLAFRPTSETMFCDHWSNILQTYRQLPMLYNQWCSVIRWEKTTRPFLRSREFWWQEGHTIHETAEEAKAETEQQLKCYADFFENVLAIPVVPGQKTEKEKFAGAEATYTVECMMKDHKALQGATSHYFGDKFSRAYNVTFTGRDNKQQYPFQTSWGSTTRMIGAVIMTHGDNNGLVLPPQDRPHSGHHSAHRSAQARRSGSGGAAERAFGERRIPGEGGRFRQLHGLEVRRIRDEGRASAGGVRPERSGKRPVHSGAPERRREDRHQAGRAGTGRGSPAGAGAERHVREGKEESGGAYLRGALH